MWSGLPSCKHMKEDGLESALEKLVKGGENVIFLIGNQLTCTIALKSRKILVSWSADKKTIIILGFEEHLTAYDNVNDKWWNANKRTEFLIYYQRSVKSFYIQAKKKDREKCLKLW